MNAEQRKRRAALDRILAATRYVMKETGVTLPDVLGWLAYADCRDQALACLKLGTDLETMEDYMKDQEDIWNGLNDPDEWVGSIKGFAQSLGEELDPNFDQVINRHQISWFKVPNSASGS